MQRIIQTITVLALVLAVGCEPVHRGPAVSRIDIHYMHWWTETFEPRTCDNLISPSLVTITDSMAIRDFMAKLHTNVTDTAFSLDQRDWGHYTVDPRVCCALFTSNDSLVARLAFGMAGLMQYDGKMYRVDSSLWNLVLGYLPPMYLKS